MSVTSLHHLASNVYWMLPDHTTDRPVLGAVADADATLMIDAGASVRHATMFLEAIATTPAPQSGTSS